MEKGDVSGFVAGNDHFQIAIAIHDGGMVAVLLERLGQRANPYGFETGRNSDVYPAIGRENQIQQAVAVVVARLDRMDDTALPSTCSLKSTEANESIGTSSIKTAYFIRPPSGSSIAMQ